MKKRLLSLVLVGVMIVSILTACGTSKETTTEAPVEEETVVEETVEEPVEEVVADASEEDTALENVKEDMSAEETEEANTEEFNQVVAMKKVERAIDCYRKLMETEDEATYNLTDAMESLGIWHHYLNLQTSDGYYIYSDDDNHTITTTATAAMGNMYYDYANEIIDKVIPMSEYVQSNTDAELNKYDLKVEDTGETDNALMYTAITFMPYLNKAEAIEAGDFIKLDTPAFVVNGTMNAVYKMPLIVDGEDSRLYAAFDENGMLIQISNEEDYDSEKIDILTFPEH